MCADHWFADECGAPTRRMRDGGPPRAALHPTPSARHPAVSPHTALRTLRCLLLGKLLLEGLGIALLALRSRQPILVLGLSRVAA
jgi:hypothetical protein